MVPRLVRATFKWALSGEPIALEIQAQPWTKVLKLLSDICEAIGRNIEETQLVFNDRRLSNKETLASSGMRGLVQIGVVLLPSLKERLTHVVLAPPLEEKLLPRGSRPGQGLACLSIRIKGEIVFAGFEEINVDRLLLQLDDEFNQFGETGNGFGEFKIDCNLVAPATSCPLTLLGDDSPSDDMQQSAIWEGLDMDGRLTILSKNEAETILNIKLYAGASSTLELHMPHVPHGHEEHLCMCLSSQRCSDNCTADIHRGVIAVCGDVNTMIVYADD